MIDSPQRLGDNREVPVALRTWLRRAQDDVLPSAQIAQLIRSVEQHAPAFPTAPPRSTSLPHDAGFVGAVKSATGVTKLVAFVAVVGVGLGGWYVGTRSFATGGPSTPEPALTPTMDPAPGVPSVNAPVVTGDEYTAAPKAQPSAPAASVASRAPVAPFRRQALRNDRQALHAATEVASSPSRAGIGEDPNETINGKPVPPKDVQSQPASTANSEGASEEYRLLRAARQALASEPMRALNLADEHARRFARGMLSQEREAIAIEALVLIRRTAEAQGRAQRFVATYPSSPYRLRIETAIARTEVKAAQP